MRRSTNHSTDHTTTHLALILLGVLTAGLLPTGATWAQAGLTPESQRSTILSVGRGVMMHFQRMKRVEVVEPAMVEVVVASLNDLSVYGRKEGATTIYVWDRLGIHQIEVTVSEQAPTEGLVQDMRRVLGNRLTYTPTSDRVLVIEGVLPPEEADRAHLILKAAAGPNVQIVDMVRTEGETGPVATQAAQSLRKVLGEDLEYVVWNNKTVIVRGTLGDQARLTQARKVIEAAKSPELNIVDLVEYEEPQAVPPLDAIAKAAGDKFQVWRIQGKTVAVDGTVATQAELANLTKILAAFDGQATIVNLVQVVEAKPTINEAMTLVQAALGSKLVVRPLGNQALVLEGTLPSDAELTAVRDMIKTLKVDYQLIDTLRVALPEKRQVMVHVRVVDINRTALDKLGANYGQLAFNTDGTVSFVNQPFWVQLERSINNIFTFGAQVDALAQRNLAKVLSEPNLLVDDGGKANILVGGEIPIPVSSGTGVASITVEWKPFGVKLEVEPNILESGSKINLKVSPEVSALDFGNAITVNGFVLPAMRTRKASTVVTMESGRTLVLGGLLQSQDTKNVNKIPLLSSIPIIGELFKHRDFQEGKSELVISVTPEIVNADKQP
jgi:Flp pilus assembly secretin CpaC